ncbi:hypothetical protein [Bradyrhizobium sp. Bra78]|uniref:hypothetical protein n=1 Tax=Bradyrhizobium sp. Bra78 TaxID=2926010 RepID=UPI0021C57AD1|nr:hypothetical protein [Bradyrhizobium sp. Bra78]
MSKRPPKSKSKRQIKQASPAASQFKKYLVRGGLAAGPLMFIAIAFAFAPTGTYLVQTPAGRVIVEHPPITLAQASIAQAPFTQAPAERTGAAIHIAPSAIGAGVADVRVVGFGQALLDEGKYSQINHFEAYRTRGDVPTAKPE